MKRMMVSEVVAKVERNAADNEEFELPYPARCWQSAANIVRDNLVPQWQDKPDGDGWYWVRHDPEPRYVITLDGVSKCRNRKGTEYVPLNGRQVCPISPPPSES